MSLEDNYKQFETFLSSLNLSEKEILLFISNYLLKNINNYENLDKIFGIQDIPVLSSYDNFYAIKQAREYHEDNLSLEIAKIAHNLLYVSNRVQFMEEELYARK